MSKEQEIKIKINKESARIFETPGISERPEESVAPAFVAGKTQKERKFFNPEKLAAFFFYALVFLMPIFAVPLAVAPFASGKAILLFGGILLTAFFWILSAIVKGSVKVPKSALLISCGAIVLVWLASALSSGNAGLSLAGKLYDLDTFSMFFAASLALFFRLNVFSVGKKSFWFLFIAVFFGFYRIRFPILPSYFRNQHNPFQHISVQHFQFNRRLE